MKTSKSVNMALAFLVDNFIVYLIADILATFINPYEHSYQNRTNFFVIYIIIVFVYFAFTLSRYKKTLGQKLLKLK